MTGGKPKKKLKEEIERLDLWVSRKNKRKKENFQEICNITSIFGSVRPIFRFGSSGSFSISGSMAPRFVPVRFRRFVSFRRHTVFIGYYEHMGKPMDK